MGRFRLRRSRRRAAAGHGVPVRSMIPNMLTFCAAAAGITSIRYACAGRWTAAVVAILVAAFFDGIDGRVARMLKASSKLGAELDSLSDFVSFGVAPGLLVYFRMMDQVAEGSGYWPFRGVLWALALFYALCCAFRLARFNIMSEDAATEPYWKHFFTGVPAPAGAGLVLIPLVAELAFESPALCAPWICALGLLVCGLLLACRIPTPCVKHVHLPKIWHVPLLLLAILVIGMLVAQPWETLLVLGLVYLLSIPFCCRAFLRAKRRYLAEVSRGGAQGGGCGCAAE